MSPTDLAARDFGLLLMVANAMGSVGPNEPEYRVKVIRECEAYLALAPESLTYMLLAWVKTWMQHASYLADPGA